MRALAVAAAVAISLIAAFLFLQPVFSNIQNWGLYDWDQHMFYHESGKVALLTFGQAPLWTPYYCGGNVLLANPQSPYFSPFFLLVLLFGAVVGLKLEALVFMALGLLGTFLVARRLGCSSLASSFAAIAFMFSSWFAVRVVAGHTTFFPFALLPFVFLFYLNSVATAADIKDVTLQKRISWIIAAAAVLAVMFLSGGIYPFYAAVLLLVFYSLLDFVSTRSFRPIAVVAAILVLAALLSSVKLLPVVDFTSGIAAEKDVQLTSARIVFSSLLSRQQSLPINDFSTGRDLVPEGRQKELDTLAGKIPWGWHEYSAYLGIVPLLLAAAAVFGYRKNWKLIAAATFFLLLSLGDYLPVSLWSLLRNLPFFSSLHGPSRFAIVFVFFAALLAAKALSSLKITDNRRIQTTAVVILCLVVAADMLLVSRPLLQSAFPLEPLQIKSTNLGSPEVIQMLSSAPYLSQYPNLLQGIGTVNCYERLHLRIRAVPQLVDGEPYPGFVGNAYIAETNESINFTYFSSQRVSLQLSGIPKAEAVLAAGNVSELTLVINQNHYKGWQFDGSTHEAGSYRGMLAALVRKGDFGKAVMFSYASKPFALGAAVSLLAAIAAAAALWKPDKMAAIAKPASGIIRKLDSYVFRQS